MTNVLFYLLVYIFIIIPTRCNDILSSGVWSDSGVSKSRDYETKREKSTFLNELGTVPTFKTGTTIVGVCCRDGVVLGADTRSTSGALVMNKNTLKIHTIAPRISCCGAGTSADCDQLARRTGHELAKLRIERDLAGLKNGLDPTYSALKFLKIQILNPTSHRKPEAVFILGGVDETHGPSLYQINMDGTSLRCSFCALGSGSSHAIAVLESERKKWGNSQDSVNSDGEDEGVWEDISVEEAILAVRRAVQAGILNDLGSGSHVDLCVITRQERRQWREHLLNKYTTPIAISNTNASTAVDSNNTATNATTTDNLGELLVGTKIKVKELRMNDAGQVYVEETITERRRWADGILVQEMW